MTFQVMIQQFGYYNKWVGFYDLDEFLLPSPDFQLEFVGKYKFQNINKHNILMNILTALETSKIANRLEPKSSIIDGAWFNSVDIDCENKNNYYLSQANSKDLAQKIMIELYQ